MNISDIAKLAGVSRATVSRYLNDGYVSEDKKEKIRQVIEETGYLPSASAQALRTRKSKMIGVIVPKISSESVSKMVNGISTVLTERGYHIILGNTENSVDKEAQYLRLFKNNHVDGIILIGTYFTKKHKEELKKLSIPVVILGQELEGYCSVYHDDYHAAKEMTEYLLNTGCEKVAYLGVNPKDQAAGQARKLGYEEALRERGCKVEESYEKVCDFSYDSGCERMIELLNQDKTIDAVFCATDTIALGAMEAIKEAGLRIPSQISVGGIGDSRLAIVVTPKLTSARYFYESSGEEAAKMLLTQLKSGEMQIKDLKLGYEIIPRETTKR